MAHDRDRDRDRDRASPSSLPTDGNGSGASRLRRFRLSAEEFRVLFVRWQRFVVVAHLDEAAQPPSLNEQGFERRRVSTSWKVTQVRGNIIMDGRYRRTAPLPRTSQVREECEMQS